MKAPLSWLKDHIDIELPPIEIAKILTMAGLEVDAIEQIELGFTHIVVGQVTATEPHPNADKLRIATVFDGTETHQVVCGAPNCRPGILSAFAKIGATLPDEEEGKTFKVKKSKIRGVESSGMLCSEKELKISDDHIGIIEFGPDMAVGTDLASYYSDAIFEVSLTPNLGHCANIIGIARELHAATELGLHPVRIHIQEEPHTSIQKETQVEVRDSELCPRYTCRLIKDVTIAPSPQWMQNRLLACGVRPINNVVDITNYVLLEMGYPLHAFDFDRLEGHQIIVRKASEKEPFTTLDGKEQVLSDEDLLICDAVKPVALAGIMGGENSEVSSTTKNILLESAYFNPTVIRRSSKRLGLMTEASKRFERGCDPNLAPIALDRAAMLMHELAGGKIVQGMIDKKEASFPAKQIDCRAERINTILGTKLAIGEIENIFQRLGFEFRWNGQDTFTVVVPTYRTDIDAEIDLIEEVARIYGYDNLNIVLPPFHSSQLPHSPVFLFERKIRSRMLSEGLQEFLTCDLVGPSILEVIDASVTDHEALVKVLNPTSIEQSCLRTSLLPGLLQVVKHNIDHQNQDISGFEIGRVHFKEGKTFREETALGIILTGKVHPNHWEDKPADTDFYDLKGIVDNMLQELGITKVTYKPNHFSFFHDGRQASILSNHLELGSIGEIHPAVLRKLGITQRIYFAEFNLSELHKLKSDARQMQPIAIYPCSERDWTFTIKENKAISVIFSHIHAIDSRLLEECQLLDIYRSPKIGEGLKNVTLRFIYRDTKKTIAQETVDQEHARITDRVRSLMSSSIET